MFPFSLVPILFFIALEIVIIAFLSLLFVPIGLSLPLSSSFRSNTHSISCFYFVLISAFQGHIYSLIYSWSRFDSLICVLTLLTFFMLFWFSFFLSLFSFSHLCVVSIRLLNLVLVGILVVVLVEIFVVRFLLHSSWHCCLIFLLLLLLVNLTGVSFRSSSSFHSLLASVFYSNSHPISRSDLVLIFVSHSHFHYYAPVILYVVSDSRISLSSSISFSSLF